MLGEGDALSDTPAVLVVSDEAASAARLERVVKAAPRVAALRAGWGEAATTVGERARLAAVLADCGTLDDATLVGLLPELANAAELTAVPLVIGFARRQLDTVALLLLGGGAQLLCDPDEVDWAVALALAGVRGDATVRDGVHDEDRYRRLSEEVARIADTLSRLIEPSGAREQEREKGDGFVGEPGRGYGARDIDPGDVRRAIRARRLRDEIFAHAGLFEDPAWDMLLDLFAAELERRPVSVSSLCIAAAVPATTALRWITKLIDAGLLERKPDSLDRRRAFITLSSKASLAMRNYVLALKRAGLTLG